METKEKIKTAIAKEIFEDIENNRCNDNNDYLDIEIEMWNKLKQKYLKGADKE